MSSRAEGWEDVPSLSCLRLTLHTRAVSYRVQCKQIRTNSSLRNKDKFYINRPTLGPLGHAALHRLWDAEKRAPISRVFLLPEPRCILSSRFSLCADVLVSARCHITPTPSPPPQRDQNFPPPRRAAQQ